MSYISQEVNMVANSDTLIKIEKVKCDPLQNTATKLYHCVKVIRPGDDTVTSP